MTLGSRLKKGSSFEPIGSRRGSAVDRGKHSPFGPACDGGCQTATAGVGQTARIAWATRGNSDSRGRDDWGGPPAHGTQAGAHLCRRPRRHRGGRECVSSAVTAQMVHAFAAGTAAVSVLARHAGAEIVVVDV